MFGFNFRSAVRRKEDGLQNKTWLLVKATNIHANGLLFRLQCPRKKTMLYITDRNWFNKVIWETEASRGKRMQLEKRVYVSATLAWHKFHFYAQYSGDSMIN